MNLNSLLPANVKQVEHIFIVNDEFFGIVNPGYLLSFCQDEPDFIEVIGPAGVARIEVRDSSSVVAALLATKVVSLGSIEAIREVNQLLLNSRTSRTTSFVCSIADSCDQVQEVMKSWQSAAVCVVGCGGIGSLATLILSGAGIKRLILVDPDVIEESNLNRQLFWTLADVGRHKVEILKTRILERFPWVEIETMPNAVSLESASSLIHDSDAVLFTADEPAGISRSVGFLASQQKKIFVSAGYFLDNLIVECNQQEDASQNRLFFTDESAVMPSFGPSNSELAGVATSELLLQLAGIHKYDDKFKLWKPAQWPQ